MVFKSFDGEQDLKIRTRKRIKSLPREDVTSAQNQEIGIPSRSQGRGRTGNSNDINTNDNLVVFDAQDVDYPTTLKGIVGIKIKMKNVRKISLKKMRRQISYFTPV